MANAPYVITVNRGPKGLDGTGGGGGSVASGTGIVVTGTNPQTVAADFGAVAGKVLEATKASVQTVLGLGTGFVKAASGVLSAAALGQTDVEGALSQLTGLLKANAGALTAAVKGDLEGLLALSGTGSRFVKAAANGAISAATIAPDDLGASASNVGYRLTITGTGTMDWQASSGGAPTTAQYLTLATDATLTNERVLSMNSTRFTVTDGGAGGNYTVDLSGSMGSTALNFNSATTTTAGWIRVGITAQTILASRISGDTANIHLLGWQPSVSGQFSGALVLGGDTSGANGVSAIYSYAGGAGFYVFPNTTSTVQAVNFNQNGFSWGSALSAPTWTIAARTTDNATNDLTIRAQDAYSVSTGTNRDGATIMLQGGARKDTNGRRKGFSLALDSSSGSMLQGLDVQAAATAASRVLALFKMATVTTADLPTGTGDLVMFMANCATAPTVNPVGGVLLYAEGGSLKARSANGNTVTLVT